MGNWLDAQTLITFLTSLINFLGVNQQLLGSAVECEHPTRRFLASTGQVLPFLDQCQIGHEDEAISFVVHTVEAFKVKDTPYTSIIIKSRIFAPNCVDINL